MMRKVFSVLVVVGMAFAAWSGAVGWMFPRLGSCHEGLAFSDGVKGEPLVSGLFTSDLKKKPAYLALEQLINKEWTTKLSVPAKDGKVAFRGFCGRYRLTWKDAGGKDCAKFVELAALARR